jgi:hypothetical protein
MSARHPGPGFLLQLVAGLAVALSIVSIVLVSAATETHVYL